MKKSKKRKSIYTKSFIIDRLVKLHEHWYHHDREKVQLNYNYFRLKDSNLSSAVDRSILGISGFPEAFEMAGINPLCHLKGVLYGRSDNTKEKKKRFLEVLYYLILEVGGIEKLNDSTMNSRQTFVLPSLFQENKSFPVCEKHKCPFLPISFQSIYSQGRRLYGDWKSAIKAAGFNYEDIRRKKPKYTREEVIEDLLQFVEDRQDQWSIQVLRNHNHALYKGIFNSHSNSPFFFANRPVMETVLIELQYNLKKESAPGLSPETFYETFKKTK